jgi:hypothetical protein
MASEKQIAANRRNALLSSGPKTPEGKKASSRNSFRHGLTARNNEKSGGEIESSLRPEGAAEHRLAQSIAGDHFRLNRARSMLNGIGSRAIAADPHDIQRFAVYERRSYRSMHRSLRLLNEMQATRRALEQASLLRTEFPGPNGFGFANDKIAACNDVALAILSPVVL